MAGGVTKSKHFFSAVHETRWLNGLGRKGYRLWAVNGRKYAFSVEEGKSFSYTMEWQDCAIDSPESRERVLEKASLGEPVCAQRSLWLYFVSEHPGSMSKKALKKNRAHYRNPFLFFLILALICAGLAVYHIKSVPFLESEGLTITIPTFKGNENPILDLLLRLVYGLWLVAYNYFLLFGHFLGNTLATAVVSVLTPLFLVFLTLAAVWGAEWTRWLRVKPFEPESDEDMDVVPEEETGGPPEEGIPENVFAGPEDENDPSEDIPRTEAETAEPEPEAGIAETEGESDAWKSQNTQS